MNRDTLLQYFERHYAPRRGMLPRIPLGMNPDEIWQEIQNRRKAKSTTLPIHNPKGVPYWYVTTERMISASETLVDELITSEESPLQELSVFTPLPSLAPLEEVFYTSYVEGSSMTMQAAMAFLQSGDEPRDIEEQMVANNRSAMLFAASNLYHPVDEEFIKMLALILTQNMEGGGQEYRTSDWVEIPSMMGERYELPSATSVPNRMKELTAYLADPTVHPLLKAAVAQAWVLSARPFPEGNERLARLLSTVILIRSGYTFLGEVSQSALIAKNGYPYYDAVANILRTEHDGDLTYFMEYYLILLGQAVYERRNRKAETEVENQTAGIETVRTALVSAGADGTVAADGSVVAEKSAESVESNYTESDEPTETIELTETAPDSVAERLAADGYVSLLDETNTNDETSPEDESNTIDETSPEDDTCPEGDTVPWKGDKNRWSGENYVRKKLQSVIEGKSTLSSHAARILIKYLEARKYIFTVAELQNTMGVSLQQTVDTLNYLYGIGIVKKLRNDHHKYTFGCGVLSHSNYTTEMLRMLKELTYGHTRDRRIGMMLLKYLKKGRITIRDYDQTGETSKWGEDMRLAEQLGLVERITKDHCLILRDARPCFDMLNCNQRMRVRQMYETFGDELFSHEMLVTTLDYKGSTASACLHQFTLLRILDCRKGDMKMNLYKFRINPNEHPEFFGDVA